MSITELKKETIERYSFLLSNYKRFEQENKKEANKLISPYFDDFMFWMLENYPSPDDDNLTLQEFKTKYNVFNINEEIKLSLVFYLVLKEIVSNGIYPFKNKSKTLSIISNRYKKFLVKERASVKRRNKRKRKGGRRKGRKWV